MNQAKAPACKPGAVADVQREQGTLAATDLVFGLQLMREHHITTFTSCVPLL